MALSKAYPTQWGIEASYWNIGEYNTSFHNKTAGIVLYGFSGPEKGKILDTRYHAISIADEEGNNRDITRDQLYALLKQTSAWQDAVDV